MLRVRSLGRGRSGRRWPPSWWSRAPSPGSARWPPAGRRRSSPSASSSARVRSPPRTSVTRAAAPRRTSRMPYSYADGTVVAPTSTAIASGTNNYVEFTMSSGRPGGLSVSGAQFNFRLASSRRRAGRQRVLLVRRPLGRHRDRHPRQLREPLGCSTGTTQTTLLDRDPEVTSTDQANGLVIRAYVWETGTKIEDGQHRPRHGHAARPRTTRSPPTRSRRWTTPAARPTTAPWPLATVDATDVHGRRPTGRPPRPPRRSTSS